MWVGVGECYYPTLGSADRWLPRAVEWDGSSLTGFGCDKCLLCELQSLAFF